jgi:hypothetical protein
MTTRYMSWRYTNCCKGIAHSTRGDSRSSRNAYQPSPSWRTSEREPEAEHLARVEEHDPVHGEHVDQRREKRQHDLEEHEVRQAAAPDPLFAGPPERRPVLPGRLHRPVAPAKTLPPELANRRRRLRPGPDLLRVDDRQPARPIAIVVSVSSARVAPEMPPTSSSARRRNAPARRARSACTAGRRTGGGRG